VLRQSHEATGYPGELDCQLLGLRLCPQHGVHLPAQPSNWQNRDPRLRREEEQMPDEEFRKLFEQRPEPGRWQRIIRRTRARLGARS